MIRVDVSGSPTPAATACRSWSTSATRPQYPAWAETKVRKGGERALDEYVAEKNARSIDGLPAVDVGDLEPA